MPGKPYETASLADIATLTQDYVSDAEWKPLRHHFGIGSFGTNAYVAQAAGATVVNEHTEADTRHEELYFVAQGHATFTVEDEEVDAPAGTFVYVRDPELRRGAIAREAGTAILAFGGEPGVAYTVSEWERKYAE